jgi:hypothetical protein
MKISENVGKYIFSGLLISSLVVVYVNYASKKENPDEAEFKLIQRYLANNSSLARSDKPVLWIHNEYDLNDRNWLSFGSRNTNELNKPLVYLSIDSIIKKCDKSFNICLIDDNSFVNLIPGWNIDLETIPEPNRKHYRLLAILHLLYLYGGMHVPSTLLCFDDLIKIYDKYTSNDNFFVSECLPTSILSDRTQSFPSLKVKGSLKNNEYILKFIHDLEYHFIKSLTSESAFKGSVEKHLLEFSKEGNCNIVPGKVFGYFDNMNSPITVSELMTDSPITLNKNNIALDIPVDDIISSKYHNWMSKISIDEIPNANNNIGYLFHKIYCLN